METTDTVLLSIGACQQMEAITQVDYRQNPAT
jgi:hypothetical protein